MSLNIPPEFERAVLERVRSGMYESTDDVLRACLLALDRAEEENTAKLEALQRDLQSGLDQLERGQVVSSEEAIARLYARIGRRAAS